VHVDRIGLVTIGDSEITMLESMEQDQVLRHPDSRLEAIGEGRIFVVSIVEKGRHQTPIAVCLAGSIKDSVSGRLKQHAKLKLLFGRWLDESIHLSWTLY